MILLIRVFLNIFLVNSIICNEYFDENYGNKYKLHVLEKSDDYDFGVVKIFSRAIFHPKGYICSQEKSLDSNISKILCKLLGYDGLNGLSRQVSIKDEKHKCYNVELSLTGCCIL